MAAVKSAKLRSFAQEAVMASDIGFIGFRV